MGNLCEGQALFAVHHGTYVLKLVGDIRVPLCPTVDSFIEQMFGDPSLCSILIDLSDTHLIDSTALGLLAKIAIRSKKRFQYKPVILSTNPDVNRIVDSMGFEKVFSILHKKSGENISLAELPIVDCGDREVCKQVIDAHRALMTLSEENKETFKDVVAALEIEHPMTAEDPGSTMQQSQLH